MPTDSVPDDTPVKVLRGFEKRQLAAGASTNVQFQLTRRDLSYWDVGAQAWALPKTGNITVQVGWSSRDLPLQQSFSLVVQES